MKKDAKEGGAELSTPGVEAPDEPPAGPDIGDHASRLDDFMALAAGTRQRTGELLRAAERISADQLEAALAEQRRGGGMLGDVLVGLGMISRRERDVVLAFQKRQAAAVPGEGKFRLGNILLSTGQITLGQLHEALDRQRAYGGRLGDALIAAGHATLRQVALGRLSQQRLVAMALIAAMALVAPLAPIVSSAEAGQASANLQVSATVVASARLRADYQASRIAVTENDIAQGHIDVPAASRFSVSTNSRSGYLIAFRPVGDVFQAVQIEGLSHPAQLGADGGTAVERGPVLPGRSRELSYRFILRPGLQSGDYPWPLMLSVRPL